MGSRGVEAAIAGRSAEISLDDVTLDPVIPEPPAIWCVGVNYVAHRDETGRKPTDQPVIFMRIGASQVGHREAMELPKASTMFDYEGELAVVIGKGGRHIPQSEAMSHIAGYSCYNDGTLRDCSGTRVSSGRVRTSTGRAGSVRGS